MLDPRPGQYYAQRRYQGRLIRIREVRQTTVLADDCMLSCEDADPRNRLVITKIELAKWELIIPSPSGYDVAVPAH